ncbi:MAG TPA: ABC transporter substrate-binding protein [Streptosporangiaceae bacterium]|nr:ABC transporter substrate-binding protein [Streptosporangiaceae bacterium]
MTTRVFSRRLAAITVTVALAVAAAGCSSSTTSSGSPHGKASVDASGGTFPVTVAAANGPVHIAKRPTSIISLAPSATEMLYAVGAGSQVKAVDQDSNYPAQAPTSSLSGLTPNIEAIVADKPDLVVVSYDAATLTKRLAQFSIPVLSLPAPADVNGVYSELTQLGQATGDQQQAAAEVTRLRSEIRQVVAAVPHHAKPLTYYYELDQTYYSVTSSTFIGRLLGLLGMKSIADTAKGAAAAGGYPQLSSEYIVKANPDYVILADTICCHQDAAKVAARPGWAGLAAVKAHHVIALNDDIASRWGPRVVDLLRAVLAGIRGGK